MNGLPNQLQEVKPGLNYLVPKLWYREFLSLNQNGQNLENLVFPQFDTRAYVDSFLYDYQGDIVAELNQKCNHIPFRKWVLNAEPKVSIQWKVVPGGLWKLIEKRQEVQPIYTYCLSKDPSINELFPVQQLQIVFCSKAQTMAFIGFLPKEAPIISLVREIGFELGYVELQTSKITFPVVNSEKGYFYHELEGIKLGNSMDNTIIAFNLENNAISMSQNQEMMKVQKSFNDSNEAVAGEFLSDMNMKSRGGDSLFSFNGDSLNHFHREYHTSEIFKNKSPEEISLMKINAKDAISGELIELPSIKPEKMDEQLEKLANQIILSINCQRANGIHENGKAMQ